MLTLRSVLDGRKAIRQRKIHRVLYTWRLGIIDYYLPGQNWYTFVPGSLEKGTERCGA